ncbi:12737_t:CDS:2 [Cetraspora pellucida]|uniref:12737_t:CDS:1 n=1 Tax=Cetraspora pellucida TaxID=1433469 RepID=A0A9N9A871_9GLOM|nr:12737_t:CDS:2 [Cetraspora pellucida]
MLTDESEVIFSSNGYIEYQKGNMPLIVCIPYEGHQHLPEVPNHKNSSKIITKNNLYIQEIGKDLKKKIIKLKSQSYLIINHLHRSKLDANCKLEKESSAPETKKAWKEYHNFISRAIEDIKEKHGCGLLIDLHGHEQSENIKLEYMLLKEELMLSDEQINQFSFFQTESSITNLYFNYKRILFFSELLYRQFKSLGRKLQSYSYETTPSHINQYPKDEKYFSGRYTIKKYKLILMQSKLNYQENIIQINQIKKVTNF